MDATKPPPPDSTIIIARRRDKPFSMVPNEILNDHALSWKAKGIFAYLIGKPDHWKAQVTDLVNRATDGRDSVQAGLKELRANGYAQLERHTRGGQVVAYVLRIAESKVYPMNFKGVTIPLEEDEPPQTKPQTEKSIVEPKKPETENPFVDKKPETGKPETGKPDVENPPISNKEGSNTDSISNKEGKASAKATAALPMEVAYWNDQKGLPKVLNMSKPRTKAFNARMSEDFFKKNVVAAIDKIAASQFCAGNNRRRWKANFDFLLQPGTIAKVMEGHYDNQGGTNPVREPSKAGKKETGVTDF